ncbi:MAG: PKD domain-containing protein, partial [Paracoccaceae bacterium]
ASLSLDESGFVNVSNYDFTWTFSDGTVIEGVSADRIFEGAGEYEVTLKIELDCVVVDEITRGFDVDTKDIARFDFEGGPVDISDNDPVVVITGTDTEVDGSSGSGFLIGDGNKLEISKGTSDIHDMEAFGLSLDMKPTGDEQTGTFLNFYKVLTGTVGGDGRVTFKLTTDEGTFSLTSEQAIFDDEAWHRIGLAYDGSTGQLEMFADGQSVASVAASGITAPQSYYGLVFGNTFKDSIDAIIDNVEMSADPEVGGNLADPPPPVDPGPDPDPDPTPDPDLIPDPDPDPIPDPDPDPAPDPDPTPPDPDPAPAPEENLGSFFEQIFASLFDALAQFFQALFGGNNAAARDADQQDSGDSGFTTLGDILDDLLLAAGDSDPAPDEDHEDEDSDYGLVI